jgi:hypothetical protein
LLLNSFEKGHKNNIWEVSNEGLTLEVGTNVDYAEYVNDGHWTNKKGQKSRFVPGVWRGDNLIKYVRGSKTAWYLHKMDEGSHYGKPLSEFFERISRSRLKTKDGRIERSLFQKRRWYFVWK